MKCNLFISAILLCFIQLAFSADYNLPENTCGYKYKNPSIPVFDIPKEQPNSPGDVYLNVNNPIVLANGNALNAGQGCNGQDGEVWDGTKWTKTWTNKDGSTSNFNMFYATAQDHVNIRTLQTNEGNLGSTLAGKCMRLWITCNNGYSHCLPFCFNGTSSFTSGNYATSSSVAATTATPTAQQSTTSSPYNGANLTCAYKFNNPSIPYYSLPKVQPNSPGDITLNTGNPVVLANGNALNSGQGCNGNYGEYWTGSTWTNSWTNMDGGSRQIDMFYTTNQDKLNIRTLQTNEGNLKDVLAGKCLRLWITCNNGYYGCLPFCINGDGSTTAAAPQVTTGITTKLLTTQSVSTGITSKSLSTGVTSKDLSTGVTSKDLSTGVTSKDLSTGVTSKDLSTGVTSKDLSTGVTSADLSTGVTSKDLSTGVTSKDISTGVTSKDLSTGVTSKDLSTGVTSADLSTGITSKDISTGVTSADLSTGVTSADLSTGVTSKDLSTGVTSQDLSTGVTSADLSTGVTSKDISTGVTTQEITTGITSKDLSTGVTSDDITTGITSKDLSTGVTSGDITTGITSKDLSTGVTSQEITTGVTSKDLSTGVIFEEPAPITTHDITTDQKEDNTTVVATPTKPEEKTSPAVVAGAVTASVLAALGAGAGAIGFFMNKKPVPKFDADAFTSIDFSTIKNSPLYVPQDTNMNPLYVGDA